MAARSTARLIAVGALLAALVAVWAVTSSGDDDGHRVHVEVPSARFIIPGLSVKAAGQPVGEVTDTEVTLDNKARLELRIDEDAVWPLSQGTKARLRFAGTVKMSGRYLELAPPEKEGPPIPEGGTIEAVDVTSPEDFVTAPQEFDDLFRIFDARTRRDMKAMLEKGGAALDPAQDDMRRTLDTAPSALEQAHAVMADLGDDRDALDTLVRSSDRVVNAIDSSDPDVGRLVSGSGSTFAAVAAQSRDLEVALDRMPETLTSVRRTLAHADRTLVPTQDLVKRLAPGVKEVRKLAPPLNDALDAVTDVAPDARRTVATLRRATPDLNPFLQTASRLMPAIGSIGKQTEKSVHCIRPYSPEIGNMFVVWTGYWGGAEPDGDHLARAMAGTFPWPNGNAMTPVQVRDSFPGITSSFPRPPGQIVNQPWLVPECNITKDALDPSKDPEARGIEDYVSRDFIEVEDPPTEAGR